MKKTIIAGVASAVLAAMPVVGVFAADTDTEKVDTLRLTIDNACTFERISGSEHASTVGTWGDDDNSETVTDDPNTLFATVANDESYDALGTSSFTVTCNNQYGYTVSVAGTAFTADTAANSTGTYAWGYTKGGTLTTADSMWTIASGHAGASWADSNAIVAQASAPVSNDTFTVTYKAYVDATQPADSYTATATYNFAQKAGA